MKPDIIGVDLGGTKVTAGRVAGDAIIKRETTLVSAQSDQQTVVSEVISTIEKVFTPATAAIGVGVPSVVDIEKGIVYDVQNIPSWREVPLQQLLEDHFSVPVKIDNDANCFTMGEFKSRRQQDISSLVGLIIGTGAAAGIIANGQLYHGNNCGAGEFGMLPYLDSNYEHYCTGRFFVNAFGQKGQTLFDKASNGDVRALGAFQDFGKHLGQLIIAVLYSVDPEVIVLGGSVAKSFAFFEAEMYKSLEAFAYKQSLNHLQICVSGDPEIALLGAAALHYPNPKE